ncbi:MAG: pyridoxamine 5'-phosphate oxidase family protein [Candidatus Paceibacterota bacterium]
MSDIEKRALDFMKSMRPCVIATADSNGKTEAAMVYGFTNDDFSVYLSTNSNSRKIENIRKNSAGSVVFADSEKMITVQMDGNIAILEGEEAQKAKGAILSTDPTQKMYVAQEPITFMKFTPSWMRFGAFLDTPSTIHEKSFNVY